GLIAGIYPAFYLSRTRPLQFLKGGPGITPRKSLTRKVLVVFQFTAAVILTAVAIVVLSQIQFSRNWDKGFDDHDVVVMEFEDARAASAIGPLKNELLNDPGVLGVSACDMLPGTQNARMTFFHSPDQPGSERVLIRMFSVDPDFASVMGLGLTSGRQLSAEDASSDGRNVVIDQRAVAALGLQESVGARLTTEDEDYNVIGILRDFHSVPTFTDDWPIMMNIQSGSFRNLLVRLKPETATATIDRIKAIWERSVPTQPFEYSYYDQLLAGLYGNHEKFGTLLGIFSLIALVIAGLGVFSLASYAAERRRREIGIRKVVGATVASILGLLGSEFVVLVLTASVIGSPIAWYLSNRWLERFVYRIDVGIGLLLFAGAVSLIVAVLGVSYQAIRAARANPVEALRYE
ncbi:MAG: ABC transporter permease, partial [candidate division Zixibacteria bacterium]|nr:ABC transporter permease [candidate division Zixibacteria bacterium]